MSTRKNLFIKWVFRVLKKGFWLLGIIPLLLDYITAFIPVTSRPKVVQSFIEKGGNWGITTVFFVIGLLISTYLVHKEDEIEKYDLQLKLDEIITARPKITLGLKDKSGNSVENFTIILHPIPKKPDFDGLISEKRKQLLDKQSLFEATGSSGNISDMLRSISTAALIEKPNKDYQKDVERYLIEYREYLILKWAIVINRSYKIYPIVINHDGSSATDVIIELLLPPEYQKPDDFLLKSDSLPTSEKELLIRLPREPKPTRNLGEMMMDSAVFRLPIDNTSTDDRILSRSPFYQEKDGIWKITYGLEKLIPHYVENNLEPFGVWACDIENPTVWKIQTKIYSSELSDPMVGEVTLSFIFE